MQRLRLPNKSRSRNVAPDHANKDLPHNLYIKTKPMEDESANNVNNVQLMNTNFEVVNFRDFDILLTDIKGE